MNVRGTQHIEVTLSEAEQKSIVKKYLEKKYQLRTGNRYCVNYIRDGKLMQSEEISAGCHSYDEEKVLRDATPFDEAVLAILRDLR